MVTINYQAYGTKRFKLRLRLYKDGETKYVSVDRMLHGNLLKKHWNSRGQVFRDSAPFSEENNKFLINFKKKYSEKAKDWTGTLSEFLLTINGKDVSNSSKEGVRLSELFSLIIEEKKKKKHADGTMKGTFEVYEKAERRFIEFCQEKGVAYDGIYLDTINSTMINNFFDWVQLRKKGYVYCSVMLHSVFSYADKMGWFKFDKLKSCKWKGKYGASKHKHETLTKQQCEMFAALKLEELPNDKNSDLYRDFCLFMLSTGQSPCDAISLKYSNIVNGPNGSYFEFKRRKISEVQSQPCNVPINAEMQRIMLKWRYLSSDGYVFPIRNSKTIKHEINNYDIKKFIQRLNVWLKKVGDIIGCNFPLHSYVFRHTAITGWISQGVDLIYVANTAGTSVKNCESIYYDNLNDSRNRSHFLSISNY